MTARHIRQHGQEVLSSWEDAREVGQMMMMIVDDGGLKCDHYPMNRLVVLQRARVGITVRRIVRKHMVFSKWSPARMMNSPRKECSFLVWIWIRDEWTTREAPKKGTSHHGTDKATDIHWYSV